METWRNIEDNAKCTIKYCDKKIMVAHIKTTGFTNQSKIIQFSARLINIASGVEESHANIYINPGEPLSDRIKELTHLNDSIFANKEPEDVRIPQIIEYIRRADVLVSHNVQFLTKMLSCACGRTGVTMPNTPLLDIREMARDLISPADIADYKLDTVYRYINPEGVFLSGGKDVVAAQTEVLMWCISKYIAYIKTLKDREAGIDKHIEYCYYWENPHKPSQKRLRVVFDKDKKSPQNKYIYYDCIKKCWGHSSDSKAKKLFDEIDKAKLEHQILEKYAWLSPKDISSLAAILRKRQKERA